MSPSFPISSGMCETISKDLDFSFYLKLPGNYLCVLGYKGRILVALNGLKNIFSVMGEDKSYPICMFTICGSLGVSYPLSHAYTVLTINNVCKIMVLMCCL